MPDMTQKRTRIETDNRSTVRLVKQTQTAIHSSVCDVNFVRDNFFIQGDLSFQFNKSVNFLCLCFVVNQIPY